MYEDDECQCVTCNTDTFPQKTESIPDSPFSYYQDTIDELIEVRED